jgi:alkylation response protein AidB-like acyl-CoA dehydrogenase
MAGHYGINRTTGWQFTTDIITSAKPTDKGYYLVKGQKIFISGGQHEAVDNFVHLTLARIEGAPAGVEGFHYSSYRNFVLPMMEI